MVERKFFAVRRTIALVTVAAYLGVEVGLFFIMGEAYDISRLQAASAVAFGAYFYKRKLDKETETN